MAIYRNYSRDQVQMKTMCINDYIEKDHHAKIIVNIISKMDLKSFDKAFNNDMGGKPAYPVNNLLALLIYSYLDGVYSSRKIERYCREHLAYKYLCCDDPPDHVTITRFYSRFHEQIRHVFAQTIYIGIQEGLITFETLSFDGVKISAMSSKSRVINIENSDMLLKSIENQIDNLMYLINKTNDIDLSEKLVKKINKKNAEKQRIIDGLEKLKSKKLEIAEKKKTMEVENVNNLCLTEHDSPLMKQSMKYYDTCYNGVAAADGKCKMSVTAILTSNCTDRYNGMISLKDSIKMVGINNIRQALSFFDAGFWNNTFIEYGYKNNLDLYIAYKSMKKMYCKTMNAYKKQKMNYLADKDVFECAQGCHLTLRGHYSNSKGSTHALYIKTGCSKCPLNNECITTKDKTRKRIKVNVSKSLTTNNDTLDPKNSMIAKMDTEEAKEKYKKRFYTIEPVFGEMKNNRKFTRFSVWGIKKAETQWILVNIVHNFSKIIRYANRNSLLNKQKLTYTDDLCYKY